MCDPIAPGAAAASRSSGQRARGRRGLRVRVAHFAANIGAATGTAIAALRGPTALGVGGSHIGDSRCGMV